LSNTIKTTNRTIEISGIDSNYMMDQNLDVQSVVLIPGTYVKNTDLVYIVENSPYVSNPIKALLTTTIDGLEPRAWIFNQRLQLGFVFNDCVFNTLAKVIFNIGEIHHGNDSWTTEMKMKLSAQTAEL